LVGRQTLMHSAIVLAPLIVVRLLGYRIGGQSSVTTPAVGQEDCLSHS